MFEKNSFMFKIIFTWNYIQHITFKFQRYKFFKILGYFKLKTYVIWVYISRKQISNVDLGQGFLPFGKVIPSFHVEVNKQWQESPSIYHLLALTFCVCCLSFFLPFQLSPRFIHPRSKYKTILSWWKVRRTSSFLQLALVLVFA